MKQDFSFYNRCERPWPNRRLKNAVIIGHTTSTTAKIWIRTKEAGDYFLCLVPIKLGDTKNEKELNGIIDQTDIDEGAVSQKFPNLKETTLTTIADNDFTAVHEFDGLESGQRYRYFLAKKEDGGQLKVVIDAVPYSVNREQEKDINQGGGVGLSFRTLKESPDPSFSFALFSCHNPYVESDDDNAVVGLENMPAWDSFGKTLCRHSKTNRYKDLSFVIAGGDQCYTDGKPKISIWEYLYKVMGVGPDGKVYPSKEDMISWYRDIYRAYWGFPQVRSVYGMYPIYMIWDDHEICDGWGSYEACDNKDRRHLIFDKAEKKGMALKQAQVLLDNMFQAACQVYNEYEHSHNPTTEEKKWHYSFEYGNAHFFVMDGRGHRDITKSEDYKILGEAQMRDFVRYVEGVGDDGILFVVSAVPMIHTCAWVNKLGVRFSRDNADDLKDAWESDIHDKERGKVMDCLWEAAKRGVRVCILSGDVHASALFSLTHNKSGKKIYQITSSAITYHMSLFMRLGTRFIVADDGDYDDNAEFDRQAFFAKSSYALIRVLPDKRDVIVSFYDAMQQIPIDRREINPKKTTTQDIPGKISIDASLGSHTLSW